MRVVALYHPNSEHGGLVMDFAAEFERYKNKKLQLISLETAEGSDMATLYGVTRYPAFLVMSDEGGLQRLWEGQPPLMDELSYYMQEAQAPVSRLGRTIMPLHA